MKGKQLTMSFLGTIIRGALLVIAILVIYKAGTKAYDFGFRIFTEEPMSAAPGRDIEVVIAQGDGTSKIGKMFEEKGLIRDAQLFSIQKKLSQYSGDIQPGTYTLNTSMTTEEMFAILAGTNTEDGEAVSEPDELQDAGTKSEPTPLQDAAETATDTSMDTSTEDNTAEEAQ